MQSKVIGKISILKELEDCLEDPYFEYFFDLEEKMEELYSPEEQAFLKGWKAADKEEA